MCGPPSPFAVKCQQLDSRSSFQRWAVSWKPVKQ
ncbi:unnamed protein product [Haemonchus placei]|uniref:Uncharacterized protein n=1 Tax=Haemonchus placei TaxID=6290 RepID=A0A0N4X123_HAEPC|nr:unnamed protein product [Haemonchus placei]